MAFALVVSRNWPLLVSFALAGWEPTTGGLRVDLLFGCPLLLETRVMIELGIWLQQEHAETVPTLTQSLALLCSALLCCCCCSAR
jgi:hypothetical protein